MPECVPFGVIRDEFVILSTLARRHDKVVDLVQRWALGS